MDYVQIRETRQLFFTHNAFNFAVLFPRRREKCAIILATGLRRHVKRISDPRKVMTESQLPHQKGMTAQASSLKSSQTIRFSRSPNCCWIEWQSNLTESDSMAEGIVPNAVVVGAGFSGATVARELAERADMKVLVLEKRSHIGGNCYDVCNQAGILVHMYGPHNFHTSSRRVYDYLSRFTEWNDYRHAVVANVHGRIFPVPFNLNSLQLQFEESKARRIEQKLISKFGFGRKVPILELRNVDDDEIKELAEYVYENVFLGYTRKQWGKGPEEIDPSVTGRVPVLISRDNRYFQDEFQGNPKEGYTAVVERMLDHPNIKLLLNVNAKSMVSVLDEHMILNGRRFDGIVVFTGPIDEFFGLRFGRLPYRSLDFVFETHTIDFYQVAGQVNYPVDEEFTRIAEFKHMTKQQLSGRTTIAKEYPKPYESEDQIPFYPVSNSESASVYRRYLALASKIQNFYLLGRLGEFKYCNMDESVQSALSLSDRLIKEFTG
jgi:UDP-galactopyranose mutase